MHFNVSARTLRTDGATSADFNLLGTLGSIASF